MRPNDVALVLTLIVGSLHGAIGPSLSAPASKNKDEPAQIEAIPGTKLNRVVLDPKAVERLGIETTEVQEGMAARKRLVAADLIDPQEVRRLGLDAPPVQSDVATASHEGLSAVWVKVAPREDLLMVSAEKSAIVRPLHRTDKFTGLHATPVPAPAKVEAGHVDGALYYRVDAPDGALASKRRVLLELPYNAARRTIVPFSAIFHDEHGQAWVYLSPEPRVFVRHPVRVDYIGDNIAFLLEGPPPGTRVVKVGGSMLFGTEFGVGH